MLLQQLAKGFAEDTHTAPVNHTDARQARQECAVYKFLHHRRGFVDGLTDHVDLAGDVRTFVFKRDGNSTSAGSFQRSIGRCRRTGQHLRDVIARDSHLHHTHLNFEMIVVQLAQHPRTPAG